MEIIADSKKEVVLKTEVELAYCLNCMAERALNNKGQCSSCGGVHFRATDEVVVGHVSDHDFSD